MYNQDKNGGESWLKAERDLAIKSWGMGLPTESPESPETPEISEDDFYSDLRKASQRIKPPSLRA